MSDERINPHIFHPRYHLLKALRRELEDIVSCHVCHANFETLVDYGCGDMPYHALFMPHIKNYCGYDLTDNDVANGKLNADGTLPLGNNQADIVLSTQALEHVVDPQLYLQECYRILRTNGLLILSTHGNWVYHPYPTDYWRWTHSGLCKIIEAQGFQIREIKGVLGLAALGLQFIADVLLPRFPIFLRTSATYLAQKLIGLVDRLHSAEDRQNNAAVFIVVARKPAAFVSDPQS